MKTVLIFFGSKEYSQSKERLSLSAKDYFDEVIAYGESDIDPQFYRSNIKIFSERRGWGYWLWKPYLLLKTMDQLDEGDICFYADATSVFTASPEVLFERCRKSDGIVLFENAHYINCNWTKADCFNLTGLNSKYYVYGKQADAAFQIYRKNQFSMAFLHEYLQHCSNYNILTDAPNISGENHPGFKDHRHDQSVLSLMAIKHGIQLTSSPRRVNDEFDMMLELKRDVKRLPY